MDKQTNEESKFSKILQKLLAYLGEGERQFLLGYVTIADIELAYFVYCCEIFFSSAGLDNPFGKHTLVMAHHERVFNLDGIKEYVNSDKWKRPLVAAHYMPWVKSD